MTFGLSNATIGRRPGRAYYRRVGALDELLCHLLPKDVISGREPFSPDVVLAGLDRREQSALRWELEAVVASDTAALDTLVGGGTCGGDDLAYVPGGPHFERRVTSAGLYASQVVVNPPGVIAPMLVQEPGGPNQWARELLEFAWTIRQPLADGWLYIVRPVPVAYDNLAMLRLDDEFSDSLRRRFGEVLELARPPGRKTFTDLRLYDAYDYLFNAAQLKSSLAAPDVVTLPPDAISAALLETVARFFRLEDVPHYIHPGKDDFRPPPRSLALESGQQVLRGQWFDELLVGLGPVTRCLDGAAVCRLRAEGVAAELRKFLRGELSQLAHVPDQVAAIARYQRDLQQIAENAVRAADLARSGTVRDRLRQAGIGGVAALASGFLGTLATAGSVPTAAAAAGIGFALGAASGAAGATRRQPVASHPFLIDVLRASHPQQ
jgi:hypothetical protein